MWRSYKSRNMSCEYKILLKAEVANFRLTTLPRCLNIASVQEYRAQKSLCRAADRRRNRVILLRRKEFRDNFARCKLKPNVSLNCKKSLKSETRRSFRPTAPGTRDFRKHLSNCLLPSCSAMHFETPFPWESTVDCRCAKSFLRKEI